MAKKSLMQSIKNLTNSHERAKNEWGNDFLKNLKVRLSSKGYRSDLKVFCKNASKGDFEITVKYDNVLGYPTQKDLIGLVANKFPTHDINWDLVDVNDNTNIITMMLSPSKEIVPVESINKIPEEFQYVGTNIYKRASDKHNEIFEIWSLTTANDGSMALIRNKGDFEVLSNDFNKFKKGDTVNTPYGLGLFQRYDDLGNGFVQVGNRVHLVAKDELKPYNQDKELTKIKDYYTQVYGPEFAKELTEDYSDQPKK